VYIFDVENFIKVGFIFQNNLPKPNGFEEQLRIVFFLSVFIG